MKKKVALLMATMLLSTSLANISFASETDVIIAEDEAVVETDEVVDETEAFVLSMEDVPTVISEEETQEETEETDGGIVDSGTCGDDLTWVLSNEGTLTISGTGAMDNYLSASSPWYGFCTSIIKVVIESGVTTIGNSAFFDCENLIAVDIPQGITIIGEHAFRDCSSLTSVTIPGSVVSIGTRAFYGCDSLSSIIIPTSITTIGNNLLGDVQSLKEVTYLGTIDQWNVIDGSSLDALQYLPIVCSDGTITRDITINTISCSDTVGGYNGTEITPYIYIYNDYFRLTEGTDYTVSYSDNINVGTATAVITGIGNYTGTETIYFTIQALYINSALNTVITLSQSYFTYDGTEKTPTVIITHGSTILEEGVDFTVSYSDNIEVGIATATITGIGNYQGTSYRMFEIGTASETTNTNTNTNTGSSNSGNTQQTETKTETESETEATSNTMLTIGDDGNWYYTENGENNLSYNGIVEYNGGSFFVANGILCSDANGLNLYDGQWYFLSNGQIQTQYTGFALYDGEWFYITNGVLDTSVNGLMSYDGEQFLFAGGRLVLEYSGLWLNSASIGGDGKWYFIGAGMLQDVSQVVMYDGEWFVVSSGVLATWFNGTIDYDGSTFKVTEGQLYSI
ncbi:MAG: leucine-rich repeat protein [Lachnospiraceae bacterium]|nr:leucine-rich repeat protein [Lachnospiraceae bacterium]